MTCICKKNPRGVSIRSIYCSEHKVEPYELKCGCFLRVTDNSVDEQKCAIHQVAIHQVLKKRDPARIDKVLNLLRDYWHRNPDLRLSQIIVNAAMSVAGQPAPSVFYREDYEVMKYLEDALK